MEIRNAIVAGKFYPDDPEELKKQIEKWLKNCPNLKVKPKVIIAPHAGYIYSGLTAAKAFKQLENVKDIENVILIGPAHRVGYKGIALSTAGYYQTPLGKVKLNSYLAKSLAGDHHIPYVGYLDKAHLSEHSLEVEVPFLQTVLKKDFKLLPVVVGQVSFDEMAKFLNKVWGDKNTVIVISSDLSHYMPYNAANVIDAQTADAIETLQPFKLQEDCACGRIPIGGLLKIAQDKKMKVQRIDLNNSGDTAGDKEKVVGYGAWSFTE